MMLVQSFALQLVMNVAVSMPYSCTTHNGMAMVVAYAKNPNGKVDTLAVCIQPITTDVRWFIRGREPIDLCYFDKDRRKIKTVTHIVRFDSKFPWIISVSDETPEGARWLRVFFGPLRSAFIPITNRE